MPAAMSSSSPPRSIRRHVIEDLHKPTLTQRAAESPEVRYLLQAYIMKLFYGVRAQGFIMGDADSVPARTPMAKRPGKFLLTMTFAEAEAGLDRFKAAGVDKIYTQNVGWNSRRPRWGLPHALPRRRAARRRGWFSSPAHSTVMRWATR